MQEALELSKLRTKRELVEQALREFVSFRKRRDIRELKGTGGIREGYDYKALRSGEGGT